jgi:hypothetical protein
MQAIQEHIARKQVEIGRHRFLTELRAEASLETALWFAPLTAFWAMGFQDVIRMNAAKVVDPELAKIIHQHRREDAGHDNWYLHDLKAMGRRDIDLQWLFGEECRLTREATYAIAAEVVRADNDILRVVLLLALEGGGHVLFGGVTKVLHEAGHSARLRYFARSHLEVEVGHDLFDEQVQKRVRELSISDEIRAEGIALVDRVFGAFTILADGLVAGRPSPPTV